jgi:hypothetical protein
MGGGACHPFAPLFSTGLHRAPTDQHNVSRATRKGPDAGRISRAIRLGHQMNRPASRASAGTSSARTTIVAVVPGRIRCVQPRCGVTADQCGCPGQVVH